MTSYRLNHGAGDDGRNSGKRILLAACIFTNIVWFCVMTIVMMLCCGQPPEDTPLYNAVARGEVDTVRLLLEQGVSPNTERKDTYSPLHAAFSRGDMIVMEMLLDAGADINEHRPGIKAGPNLLHNVFSEDLSLAQFLLDRGADPSIRDSYGSTPLHGAYIYDGKNEEMINLFVDGGANVNSQDIKGSTPLHKAASAGAYNTALILIRHGADRSIRNADGLRPIDIAREGVFTSDYSPEPTAVINEELVELLRVTEEEHAVQEIEAPSAIIKDATSQNQTPYNDE